MKALRILAAVLVAAAVVLSGCTSSGSNDGTFTFHGAQTVGTMIKASDRRPVHDFSGSLLNGGTYRLTQDDGKVTVVNFWGVWCPPCRVETPQFGLIYNAYKSKGATFVGIDVKEASRDQPRSFVQENDIRYPIVYDEDGETAVRLGNIPTQAMPFTVVLDKQHRVAAVYFVRLSPKDIEPVLNKLLAEK